MKEKKSMKSYEHEIIIAKDAAKVVNEILKDIIDLSKDEEDTLEANTGMTYTRKCEECDYQAKENRKYLAVQSVLKHKESNCVNNVIKGSKNKCEKCEFAINESSKMKKHMRDEHLIRTDSTSSPTMKKKSISEELDEQIEMMEEESDNLSFNLKDLSFNLEDMEIETPEEEMLKQRSDAMDKKVEEKESKALKEEKQSQNKINDLAKRKAKVAAINAVKVKELKKRQKQKQKDEKKKERRKRNLKNPSINKQKTFLPNIREIPKNCKHLVNKDDLLYCVPGDGCCSPNCGAAHLFQDEVFGPKLRKRMNSFAVRHWYRKYQYITPCSEEYPFRRKIKDGEIVFTDPEELLEFLKKSSDAAFMWSDSEDLAIIADMFQMRIKVITTKGLEDENPSVNWIYPDVDLKEFAELEKVKVNDMVLFNEDDSHFNLVVSGDSDLAKLGSLSNRFRIGPAEDTKDQAEGKRNESREEMNEINKDVNNVAKLRKELKLSKESKDAIVKEYTTCEKELRIQTEEVEKLKIVIKDLRKIMKLKEQIKDKDCEMEIDEEDVNNLDDVEVLLEMKNSGFDRRSPQFESVPDKKKFSKTVNKYNCTKCNFKAVNKAFLDKHIGWIHTVKNKKEDEFNCHECDFQGSTDMQLKRHVGLKHTMKHSEGQGIIKCRICGDEFHDYRNLMTHRKANHIVSVAPCHKYIEGICAYTEDACWWKHEIRNIQENIQCYICGKGFVNRPEIMRHRKNEHEDMVQQCNQFVKGTCIYQSQYCFYKHTNKTNDKTKGGTKEDMKEGRKEEKETSDFQEDIENHKPPSGPVFQEEKVQN